MGRQLRVGRFPVQLPRVTDPRLHLAATIISLHVIGQGWLRFELSIAQILVSVASAAILELVIVAWERGVLAWPASAMLTGNGVAFVLRVNGTEHGQWWSMHGWYIFAATSALGLLSKYALRRDGRPVFNPSNIALVLCFLILGTGRVNPLDFWWGPMSPPLIGVVVVLVAGAVVVTRRVGMLPLSLACWATFAAGLAIVAGIGHAMRARWSFGPVLDWTWWRILVTSPEVVVFLFFMITDPRTTPVGRRARIVFGASVGATAAVLVAPTRTEFWAKVAVLGALVVVCGARWVMERLGRPRWSWRAVVPVSVVAVALVAVLAVPARTPLPDAVEPVVAAPAAGPAATLPTVTVAEDADRLLGGVDAAEAAEMAQALALYLGRHGPKVTGLTAVAVRDPTDPQAVPRLGLRATGPASDRVYVLTKATSGYAVTGELTPQAAGLR